ncbi:NADH dehydrogenase (ubiquinone) 24 kDa subunit [Desulfofarcimen acetoxidans DSM 771]|uniref:NADH dehydrogenase (Ubiquinone) 24 kDa subunit n=1 Tax=Desulfofarcimen acetoxidans (strain ATCC 49208 / DSM 771 / KCTC 5769 / VKM B-1644 / 5575) TaxID=485916 RepID=C8VXD9_DESAS|nr:NAD(P)H-dependent oxidoreductase subunit E [Desulfofarcimen acetoxidans]ACV64535.1 NADH dehydrogenase (ubiquinone) 24 kDa subunit [Desulfofarcimen acetoxidans DSM 771]
MEIEAGERCSSCGQENAPIFKNPLPGEKQDELVTAAKNKASLYAELDKLLELYGRERGELIRVLYGAQKIFGYLPPEVQAYIAAKMDIPISEVNGVVTFYTLFVTEPRGRHTVRVCTGTACYVKGAADIMDKFKQELKLDGRETGEDGLFTLTSTRCIGACGMAPVLTVDEEVYGNLTAKDVITILEKYRSDPVAAGSGTAAAEKAEIQPEARANENHDQVH